MNYIYLYQKNDFPIILEFNKEINQKTTEIKYKIEDLCCEYCYKGLVQDLFDNDSIISVKSNFDFYKPVKNIEFVIEYEDNYDEKKLISYINKVKN